MGGILHPACFHRGGASASRDLDTAVYRKLDCLEVVAAARRWQRMGVDVDTLDSKRL